MGNINICILLLGAVTLVYSYGYKYQYNPTSKQCQLMLNVPGKRDPITFSGSSADSISYAYGPGYSYGSSNDVYKGFYRPTAVSTSYYNQNYAPTSFENSKYAGYDEYNDRRKVVSAANSDHDSSYHEQSQIQKELAIEREKERLKEIELERQREIEIERQRGIEREKQREAGREKQREIERERERQRVIEREKELREIEQERQREIERERIREIERQREREIDRKRFQEVERKRLQEIERKRLQEIELEKERQREIEVQRIREIERERQRQREKDRESGYDRNKNISFIGDYPKRYPSGSSSSVYYEEPKYTSSGSSGIGSSYNTRLPSSSSGEESSYTGGSSSNSKYGSKEYQGSGEESLGTRYTSSSRYRCPVSTYYSESRGRCVERVILSDKNSKESSSSLYGNSGSYAGSGSYTGTLSIAIDREYSEGVLAAHNTYRAKHGVGSLVLDDAMSYAAQLHAEKLAGGAPFDYSSDALSGKYGENIALKAGYLSPTGATNLWYKENLNYDYKLPKLVYTSRKSNVRFTALVWKSTTTIGVGKASGSNGKTYVVTNYWPPGNYESLLSENVFPPIY